MNKNKNIVLTGMPGSGKSTAGAILKERLNLLFFDLDTIIENKENSKITEIFKTKGEKYFRKKETEAIKSIKCNLPFILSTGGGTVQNVENIELLKSMGNIFYLYIEPEFIFERIKKDSQRPLLLCDNPKEKLCSIYSARKDNYQKSDFTINANKKVEDVACEIIKIYEEING